MVKGAIALGMCAAMNFMGVSVARSSGDLENGTTESSGSDVTTGKSACNLGVNVDGTKVATSNTDNSVSTEITKD